MQFKRSNEGVPASAAEGLCGRYHILHGRADLGTARHCTEGLEVDETGSGREEFEAVDHGSRKRREVQRYCVMVLFRTAVSGMQCLLAVRFRFQVLV